ncbi:MAG: Bug family tripartite tricarboxylate transporter substrate binding protein [Sphaerochaeta sp.]
MKHKMLSLSLVLLSLSMLWAAGTNEATAASYPNKPITMIVPYGAGGTTDISGRQLAVQLEKHLGVSITVINQGGASGSIGARTVLDAKSDGYTVLFTAESLGTQRVMGLSEMSYDDFTPIMVAVNDPKVIVVGKDSQYDTLQDLVDDIKSRPGKVKMSYTGPGGSGHVQAMIYGKFGMEMALTAYPGGADCILAVLGDQVDFTNSNYSTVTGYLESGDLKLLGISALDRLAAHPDVPTLGEILVGSEKYLSNPFTPLSLLVDKDVPVEVVTLLREAANKAVQEPAWKSFVAENSLDALYETYPDEESMRAFYKDWESLVSWMLYDSGVAKYSPEKFGIEKSQY